MTDFLAGSGRRRGVSWTRGVTWPRLAGAAVAASMGMVGLSPALASAAVASGPRVSVVVRAEPGEEPAVETLVQRLGGKVERRIAIINGFSATISQAGEAQWARLPVSPR